MEIIGLLILLVALASARSATAHPTGLLPDEPGPQPHPEPQPQPQPGPSVTPHGGGPTPSPTPSPTPKPKPAPSHAPAIIPASTTAPAPWPAAVPAELPAFPTGWEPDTPVPAAEVSRAKALIPELWKSGKPGAHKTEKTGGKWVTYLAFRPKAGMKGVAAYRLKPGAQGGTVQS